MRIRTALIGAACLAAIVTAAAATEAPRTPGAYASLVAADASACARACNDDGICMAWSFHRENQCELTAVVPAQSDAQAVAAGLSSRAPSFLQPGTPILHAEAVIAPAAAIEAPEPAERSEADELLLGGPVDDDLRLGLR
jgi:hypothetical protein